MTYERRHPSPHRSIAICVLFSAIAVFSVLSYAHTAAAAAADDLQAKIDQRNLDIQNLEKEIQSYQKQIDSLGSQASTLAGTIKGLELNRKKLEADISLTQDKIAAKSYEIQKLGSQISDKQGTISDDRRIIVNSFVEMYTSNNDSPIAIVLGGRSLSGIIGSLDELGRIQSGLQARITSLGRAKAALEGTKAASEKAKADLVALNKQLNDQRAVVVSTVAEQNSLLKQTNQSEASYKKLLADKKAQEAAFQQEIDQYESQLKLGVDPSKLPHTGSGVLAWPLDNIVITQYFGNTPFATANPQIYNGKGHTGVDFRASIGTPVKAALSGVVVGVENTDKIRGCYSYGKWVMLKHADGISTLYAHLSVQSVSVGDAVTTGEILGYSGNTGYTTGPHLHFGVYATDGVQIKRFDNSVNCKGAVIPTADYRAYLNPLSYL